MCLRFGWCLLHFLSKCTYYEPKPPSHNQFRFSFFGFSIRERSWPISHWFSNIQITLICKHIDYHSSITKTKTKHLICDGAPPKFPKINLHLRVFRTRTNTHTEFTWAWLIRSETRQIYKTFNTHFNQSMWETGSSSMFCFSLSIFLFSLFAMNCLLTSINNT